MDAFEQGFGAQAKLEYEIFLEGIQVCINLGEEGNQRFDFRS